MVSDSGVAERQSPIAGNGLFATKSFAPGDALMSKDSPTVSTVCDHQLAYTCSWCFIHCDLYWVCSGADKYKGLNFCKGCLTVKYCSKECQTKDWKANHRFECKRYRNEDDVPQATVRLAIRIVRGLAKEDPDCEALARRQSHLSLLKHTQKAKFESCSRSAQRILAAAGNPSHISLETATHIMALVLCNNTVLQTPGHVRVGDAVDSVASLVNNSCEPNALVTFESRKMTIRALTQISADEEITFCYDQEGLLFTTRQKLLRNQYHFTCKCPTCTLGKTAPREAFLKQASDMTAEAKRVGSNLLQELSADPTLYLWHIGDSLDERRLGAIQAHVNHVCVKVGRIEGDDKRAAVMEAIHKCEMTGIWPSARQPVPQLYARYLRYCLDHEQRAQGILAGVKLFFEIDPVVYPAPFHPAKVMHGFYLWSAVSTALDRNHPICAELDAQGIPTGVLLDALATKLQQWYKRTHGEESQMGKVVEDIYSAMFLRAAQSVAANGWTIPEWWQRNGELIDSLWSKAKELCPKIKASKVGLVLPGPQRSTGARP